MKSLAVALFLFLFPPGGNIMPETISFLSFPGFESVSVKNTDLLLRSIRLKKGFSGDYLAAGFAQRHHDWDNANIFLENVMKHNPGDVDMMSRVMILAMGAGQTERSVVLANEIAELEKDNPTALPLLFIALDHLRHKQYADAQEILSKIPPSGLSDFVMPVIESWTKAAQGEYDIKSLTKNTIHIYHAVLISDFLDQKETIPSLLRQSLGAQGLSFQDIERVADLYAYLGETDIAKKLYLEIIQKWPENRELPKKVKNLEDGGEFTYFKPPETPEEGVADALFDMARLLSQEDNDDSARIFGHTSLFLNPNQSAAHLLLGYIKARNKEYGPAIRHYKEIKPNDERYLEAHRLAASLYEETDNIEVALQELRDLVKHHNDPEAQIQIGDIYRRQENFKKAVEAYNKAAALLGNDIPKEFWKLHYVRGMSYERLGKWKQAEQDLESALAYKPDHPLILNYLGYAWADKGVNLEESLELIRRAVSLQPTDGYITDSLGWVLYRMEKYEEAIPHLERAVELLPYDPIINDHLGDAYWQVGRHLEANFQWKRAKNHAEDKLLISTIDQKLEQGLQEKSLVQEANSHPDKESEL